MTKEEAIEVFKNDIEICTIQQKQACDMAIKALEQQICEDCINRTELLARIDAERKHLLDIKMDGAEHIVVHHARRIIEDMPSVTPS